MRQSKLLAAALCVCTALFLLTASVAVPIVLRPFYYAHIGPLELEEYTGLTRAQITEAYDCMMDFCVGKTETFSTGALPWSQAGRDHFADVRSLFLLDLSAAAVTGLLLLGWALIRQRSNVQPYRFMKRGFAFWAAVGLGVLFLLVGGLACLDFSRAFVVFHTLFFPGKDNWLFDPRTDPIIYLLPQEFFRNCAIAIFLLLTSACVFLILWDLRKKHRHQ